MSEAQGLVRGDGTRVRVAVIGAGVAGLTAAHELQKYGAQVTVFEAKGDDKRRLGGKAVSYQGAVPIDDDGSLDPAALFATGPIDEPHLGRTAISSPTRHRNSPPTFGEHGFRFFPGFYSHVTRTMRDIPGPDGLSSVLDCLTNLSTSNFYANRADEPATPDTQNSALRLLKSAGAALILTWFFVAGPIVWYPSRHGWVRAVWAALPVTWFLVSLFSACVTVRGKRAMHLPIPTTTTRDGCVGPVQRFFLVHRSARLACACLPPVTLLLVGHPLRLLVFVAAAVVAILSYPVLATIRALWNVLQRVPPGVRPGILESLTATVQIVAVVSSCQQRSYTQWERENWWSFMNAYRYSRAFQLVFATGLTRSFVATRAERISARTGASILTQLLYDIAPTLIGREPADRVLDRPTQQAWIEPWVEFLKDKGVRFEHCTVRTIIADGGPPVAATAAEHDRHPRIRGFQGWATGTPDVVEVSDAEFDHFVLAVSTTGAQTILANSPELIAADRSVRTAKALPDKSFPRIPLRMARQVQIDDFRAIPYLDGIFKLECGWMTGVVFHLDEPSNMTDGHHLCLESRWALTAIDYAPVYEKTNGRPGGAVVNLDKWKGIVSVDVSDWFSAAPGLRPAHLETRSEVADEVWRQLRAHIPKLPETYKLAIFDSAISETASSAKFVTAPRIENSETLLVNTAGSWDHRPMAETVFENLVIAGDYVRTVTDFASMESANEAARRAVNVILHREGHGGGCTVETSLPVPGIMKAPVRVMSTVDRCFYTLGLPHPLMFVATPLGWVAGIERALRTVFGRSQTIDGYPAERRLRPAATQTPTAPAAAKRRSAGKSPPSVGSTR